MDGVISIKGTRDGLVIALGDGDMDRVCDELTRLLLQQGAFFRGGVATLQANDRSLTAPDLTRVQRLLEQHSMVLRSVDANNRLTIQAAHELGLRVLSSEPSPEKPIAPAQVQPAAPAPAQLASSAPVPAPAPAPAREAPAASPQDDSEAVARAGARGLILRRRIRAGQSVRHSGSVVIIGDVNAGSEIVAGGDIVVWGRLRGTAHAGSPSNSSAVVCALGLSPLQLRIGDVVARPDEGTPLSDDSFPEVAYVRDQTIIVERWTGVRWRD